MGSMASSSFWDRFTTSPTPTTTGVALPPAMVREKTRFGGRPKQLKATGGHSSFKQYSKQIAEAQVCPSSLAYLLNSGLCQAESTKEIAEWMLSRGCYQGSLQSLANVRNRGLINWLHYSRACSLLSRTTIPREPRRVSSLRTLLSILPLALFGIASMNSTSRNHLYLTFFSRT